MGVINCRGIGWMLEELKRLDLKIVDNFCMEENEVVGNYIKMNVALDCVYSTSDVVFRSSWRFSVCLFTGAFTCSCV